MTGNAKNKPTARADGRRWHAVLQPPLLPSLQRTESEHDWLVKVCHAAKEESYLTGWPTTLTEEMDLFEEDDESKPAPIARKAMERLKLRFLNHLAVAFGVHGAWNATTIGLLRENTKKDIVTIRLARFSASGERSDLSDAAKKFVFAFTGIHDSHDPEHTRHFNNLREVVFRLHRIRILEATSHLCRLWRDQREKIYDTIAKMSGIYDDDMYTARDAAIGNSIADLNGSIHALISAPPTLPLKNEDRLEDLILKSCKLFNLDGGLIPERLKNVLGSSLGDAVYHSVLVLVLPTKSIATFGRFAHALRRFSTIEFKRGHPDAESFCPPSKLPKLGDNAHYGDGPTSIVRAQSSSNHQLNCDNEQDLHLLKEWSSPGQELNTIHPTLKSTAFELIACALQSRIPEPRSDAYYLFGFVACQDKDEVQRLRNFYKLIIVGEQYRAAAFIEFSQALKEHRLPQFFDSHDKESFRSDFPYLENFLSTPIPERATVFRLVQFLRSESDTNPPPVLIRDYGFHLCRMREEVQILKDIYQETLNKVSVFRLHHACLRNQLLALVEGASIHVQRKHRRFLVNQGPLPDIGYQKITSSFNFSQGLFKNEKIKRMWMRID